MAEAPPARSALQAKPWDEAILLLGQANIDGRTEDAERHAQDATELGCPWVDQWFSLMPKRITIEVYGCAECGRNFGAGPMYASSACWVNGADGRHWHYQRGATDPPRDFGWSGRWAKTVSTKIEATAHGAA